MCWVSNVQLTTLHNALCSCPKKKALTMASYSLSLFSLGQLTSIKFKVVPSSSNPQGSRPLEIQALHSYTGDQ
eukprot:c38597_g1_i1 orf=46-264(+)